jgi:NhaA family Na+:H+ antiporter
MLRWIKQFFAVEALGGVVMLLAAGAALVLANSAQHTNYEQFLHWPVTSGLSLHHAVTDILMPIFFLMIGIELKHEMTHGALMTRAQKTLPLIAALGGVIFPALIYLTINLGSAEYRDGWAIPTATDIAFALCVLNLVGRHIPASAKIFLLAIAIYDDLMAILIIAIFLSDDVHLWPLLGAFACLCSFIQLRRWNLRCGIDYLAIGLLMGWMLHAGGVHATVAGMATGLCLPRITAERMMRWLHPLVSFLILPLFAFVSAGVTLSGISPNSLLHPVSMGIILGLFFGKQIGILGATWLTVKLGLASKPNGVRWREIYAMSLLAGIGFTMSLLIGHLAFVGHPAVQDAVKIGVLVASLLASAAAAVVIKTTCRPPRVGA